jgi:prepilin-type N-terminal cleavage/methylation domain-containing protein
MRLTKKSQMTKESGLTLIELMIAMTVLAVGLAGIMAIVIASLYSNSRNRTDTGATMLSQMVIEQMADVPANANTVLTVTDCAGTPWRIDTTAGGASAALKTTDNFPVWTRSDIDFNVAATYGASPGSGYGMAYVACGTNGSTGLTYDVRWNVQASGGGTTKTVVVAARIRGTAGTTAGGAQNIYFAIPAQLKTVLGT